MNIFEKAIGEGRIETDEDLKRLFWKLAKRLHPDVSALESGHEKFIELKRQYDAAVVILAAHKRITRRRLPPDRESTVRIFVELVACGFPLDRSIREHKGYLSRMKDFDERVSKSGSEFAGLIYAAERELLALKGSTTIMNHDFNLVQMYLFRFSDYTYFPTKNTLFFLRKEFAAVAGVFESHNMKSAAALVNWLLGTAVTPLK